MTEFEYDCLQKKLVALSAQHRVGRRRQVTLPSDRLNEAELARRNGPCRIYRLGRPMKPAGLSPAAAAAGGGRRVGQPDAGHWPSAGTGPADPAPGGLRPA